MNVRKLYEYIASKNSSVNKNYIGIFLSSHPECNGALEKLIVSGYVMEVDGLYGVTNKPYIEDADEEDDGPDTDWGRGDRNHVEYDEDYDR